MTGAPGPDPRFRYRDIRPPTIPVEVLDRLAASVFDPSQASLGVVGVLVAGVKLLIAVAYLVARDRLIAANSEVEKQEYERSQAAGNQGDVDHDNLGGEHR